MTNHPNRSRNTKIERQMVAQGSYGITKINPLNGQPRGSVIDVWHAWVGGEKIGTYRTREEARAAIRAERRL